MARNYTFTLELSVVDKEALRIAAERRAVADGVDLEDWRDTRNSEYDPVAADLQMLLDPGSLTGCEIENGSAEADFIQPDDDEDDEDARTERLRAEFPEDHA